MLVGLISDTHGQLRSEALQALAGVEAILHAGDVGSARVLSGLSAVAPIQAVYGNVDLAEPPLLASIAAEIEGVRIHVSHGHELGRPTPERLAARYAADVIVFGHTHQAVVRWVGGTLVVNPGAAGPARFRVKPSVALLSLPERTARIIWL